MGERGILKGKGGGKILREEKGQDLGGERKGERISTGKGSKILGRKREKISGGERPMGGKGEKILGRKGCKRSQGGGKGLRGERGGRISTGKGGEDLREEKGEDLRGGKGLRGERGGKDLNREGGGGGKNLKSKKISGWEKGLRGDRGERISIGKGEKRS